MRTLVSTCLAFSLTTVGANPTALATERANPLAANARMAFALDLYRQVPRDASENIAVSPAALSYLLAKAAESARGESRERLQEIAGPEQAQWQALITQDPSERLYDLHVANALWIDRAVDLDDSLRSRWQRNFTGQIFRTDFTKNPAFAASLVNSWVRKTTGYRVRYVVDQSDLLGRDTVLTSAVYLDAPWSTDVRVHETTSRAFHVADGTHVRVDTMTLTGDLRHAVDREHSVDVLELPYAGKRLSLLVVLPNAGEDLRSLENQLTPELLAQWTSALQPTTAPVSLPRFHIDARVDTGVAIKNLGLTPRFDAGKADFSGLHPASLRLESIRQTTVVNVSDKGAQRTSPSTSPSARIAVNQPFLFVVRDRTSGLVLAAGRVQNPAHLGDARPAYVEASRAKGTPAEQERAHRAGAAELDAHYDALMAETKRFSAAEKKIDEGLVWEARMHALTDVSPGIPSTDSLIEYDAQGFTRVTVRGTITEALLARASSLGAQTFARYARQASIRIPISSILELAEHPDVELIFPHNDLRPTTNQGGRSTDPITATGPIISEGVRAHRIDEVVARYGLDGKGVSVAVISDGNDADKDSRDRGDLPPTPAGNPDCNRGTGGTEGTALQEIIHDIAPRARLSFGSPSPVPLDEESRFPASVAATIRCLRPDADVIVDDVGTFDRALVFEEDQPARAVGEAFASGKVYVSAAGNSGSIERKTASTWEGFYRRGDFSLFWDGGLDLDQETLNDPDSYVFQFADKAGEVTAEYNLCVSKERVPKPTIGLDAYRCSPAPPAECRPSCNQTRVVKSPDDDTGHQVIVRPRQESEVRRYMRLKFQSRFSYPTASLEYTTRGAVEGHPASELAIAVGAVDVTPGPFTGAEPPSPFSSDGPRVVFFPEERSIPKPEVSGASGVQTGVPKYKVFPGTSAAAPHVAGIATLLVQALRRTTCRPAQPVDVKRILTATGLGDTGVVDAVEAIAPLYIGIRDGDSDFTADACDNCPRMANIDQSDMDGDGIGDACDPRMFIPDDSSARQAASEGDARSMGPDADADGLGDALEGVLGTRLDQSDTDGDGLSDFQEVSGADGEFDSGDETDPLQAPDGDADGIEDAHDNCPSHPNRDQADNGGVASAVDQTGSTPDGIGDACQCGDVAGARDVYFSMIGDGRVTALDAVMIQRCELGMDPCTTAGRTDDLLHVAKCDSNGDGACDARDAQAVLQSTRGSSSRVDNSCLAAGR